MKYLIGLLIWPLWQTAYAQDRLFPLTYQSNVLGKGDIDLEYHTLIGCGMKGAYSPYLFGRSLQQRIEFEAGLGHQVQTAFYINIETMTYADTNSGSMQQELAVSFSNEWKWKLLDPVADIFGLALYQELEAGGHNLESETKLILDKQWRSDLLALNIVGIYEWEKETNRTQGHTRMETSANQRLELHAAYMHMLRKGLGIGAECRNTNLFEEENGWIHALCFAGPSLHVAAGKCFANLSVLPQWINLHRSKEAPGKQDLYRDQQVVIRLLVGSNL